MATLIDERPDVDGQDNNQAEQAPQIEDTLTAQEAQPEEQTDVPEKYQGKSTAEIVRMHQEAEKLLGKQSSEVGELRQVVDDYITTQLNANETKQKEPEEEIDFFSEPERAMARAIDNHPKIKEAENISNQYRQTTATTALKNKHPDMQEILKDAKFAEWIKGSKIRKQLFAQADTQYDYDAADELFSNWKERQSIVGQTVAAEKQQRKQTVKAASTGNARGSGEQSAKKVYRRSDIIKLMKTDPDRYLALSDEIMQAYAQGRVRN
jgi:hypothetical protein